MTIKRTLAILVVSTILLAITACAPEEWETYEAPGSSISFSYLSPTDILTVFPDEEMFGVYRKNLFTVSITVQGGSRELEEMGQSLAAFYSSDSVTVDPQSVDAEIGGYTCKRLSLSGSDIAEGGIYFFRNESTDRFYVVYYSISKKASPNEITHVHMILDSIKF